jgi:hypothetical protein
MAAAREPEAPPPVVDVATMGLLDPAVEEKLKRIVATNKKIDFLDALHSFRGALRAIPLPASAVDPAQARKDTLRENIVLNGVQFNGESKMRHLAAALRAVAVSADMDDEEAEAVCARVHSATSRTASGADSYFILCRVFELPGLLLKPRSALIPPVKVDMRGAAAAVQVSVTTTNLFGLYRRDEIEEAALHANEMPEAWLMLNAVVTESMNFRFADDEVTGGRCAGSENGSGRRTLTIETPEPPPPDLDELAELF